MQNCERELFNAALEIASPDARDAFLLTACAAHPEMRERVEALLRAADSAGGFLAEESDAAEAESHGTAGAFIGRYRLLYRVGEGGFGVVYLAEQEEPVRRRVALKIIKLGMDTRAVIARFEAERQALAMMDHPNIARVFDGGATQSGRPYFVMELVQGVPITTFCTQRRLRLHERLGLFMEVCRAVHHAHQKGVIHRDLKPSNILVTITDDQPVAKVIDFGIAKAMHDPLTDKTLVTRGLGVMGTPDYMSPEQIGFGDVDIDTRSDIYSLGALLYELLTDRTPFDTKQLLAAGYAEAQRVILQDEPLAPSQRVAGLAREEQMTIAGRRLAEPVRLIGELRGDLDRIVLKCLEKDRARRYETTNALALDLVRYLNSEPVLAQPATMAYRATKFVRRHVRGVILGAWALVLLASVGIYHTRRLATERDRAQAEALKASKVSELLTGLLTISDPFRTPGGSEPTVRGLLDAGAERARKELAAEPELRAEILTVIGRTYLRLGMHDKARPLLVEALAASRAAGQVDLRLAQTMNDLGVLTRERGDYSGATSLLEQALALRKQFLGRDHNDVAITLVELGRCYALRDELARAEALQREALDIRRRVVGAEHRETATSLGDLGTVLLAEGKLAEAEPLLRESLAVHRRVLGPEHPNVAGAMGNLALLLEDKGDWSGAEALLAEAIAIDRHALGAEHWRTARLEVRLAQALRHRGANADAARLLDHAIEVGHDVMGADNPLVAEFERERAAVYVALNEPAFAEPLLRHALQAQQRALAEDGWVVATTKAMLGDALFQLGRDAEAEKWLLEAESVLRKFATRKSEQFNFTRERLASLYTATGRPERAATFRDTAP